jgi:uncharacterized protein YndB with AHSA1/START domain
MTKRNYWKILALLTLFPTALVSAAHAQYKEKTPMNEALTFNADGAKRNPDIHWPHGFHPEQAELFAHNEIVIHATCETVFTNLIDAEKWPSWYSNSKDIKLLNSSDGKLGQDTHFTWETFGVPISSRVHEFVPDSRLGWFGDGPGMSAYHTFLLLKTEHGCHVVTEEVVKGPGTIDFRKNQPSEMHDKHQLWLTSLKERAEK